MDFSGSAGDSGDAGVCRDWRGSGAATVELAVTADLRLASDYLLASAWSAGAVPDPVRWIWMPRSLALEWPRPFDFRGAGAIPAAHARALRLRPTSQRASITRGDRPGMNDSGRVHAGLVRACVRAVMDRTGSSFSREEQSFRAGAVLACAHRTAQYFALIPMPG